MAKNIPDFDNLLKVLQRQKPQRPTLYEFFLNQRLYRKLAQRETPDPAEPLLTMYQFLVDAFTAAGYDYASVFASKFHFPRAERAHISSKSMDENVLISTRADFAKLQWEEPGHYSMEALNEVEMYLPEGAKLIVHGPGGVLENVMELCGFMNLSFLLADDPELVEQIFAAVGSRLEKYYAEAAQYPSVGACMVNDDWGFKTQTMLSKDDMRKYVIPWHRRIVQRIHDAAKPALLHSCGNLEEVMTDVIADIRFDGKHSYEDAILPVEDAYERYGSRIAILGGMDVDFVCRASEAQIRQRGEKLLEYSERGGYALGSGNSIPDYMPDEKYFAMITPFLEARRHSQC